MASKSVLDRQRVGQAIVAAARTHAQEVGERLSNQLSAVLEDGETLPDLTLIQQLLARLLESRLDELNQADHDHLAEVDDDRDPRRRRTEASIEVRQQIAEIREAVRAVFAGDLVVRGLCLDGEVPMEPTTLHAAANEILGRLRVPPDENLSERLVAGCTFDMTRAADALQPKVEALGAALSDVRRERMELQSTGLRRQRSLQGFDRVGRGVARTLQGWLELAGFPEQAARVRLTPMKRRAANTRCGKEG